MRHTTAWRGSALLWLLMMLVAAAVSMTGCAPSVKEQKEWNVVWPLPPEEPKIKFIGFLKSTSDVQEARSFASMLFGEEDERGLYKPYGVAADQHGNVYVTDRGIAYVFDRVRKSLRAIGDEAGPGKLQRPANIAVSWQDGRIYITDIGAERVFVYDNNGKFLSAIGMKGDFENPIGVAVDDARKRVYVVDSKKNNVRAFSQLDGSVVLTIGSFGLAPREFHTPSHIALDKKGNIYVVDTQNFRVQIFDPEGKLIRTFGSLGDAAGQFARPKGIALDSEGHIYVVDTAFENVQIFDQEGNLLLAFGGPGLEAGHFSMPSGIAIDGNDRIYVVDQFMALVEIFQYLGGKYRQPEVR